MPAGIRATVTFPKPGDCPIAACSATANTPIEHVSTSVSLEDGPGSVTEFLASGEIPDSSEIETVFDYGTATMYRIRHGKRENCPCECLGRFGCPVHRYVADDGEVTIVFHAAEFETLQTVMGEFRERYPPVNVKRLLQPPLDGDIEERVFVNRAKLTDRQHEALAMAHEMGYFERPKRANASDVAAELDIAQSTLTEHLVTAERKLLDDILD